MLQKNKDNYYNMQKGWAKA